MVAQSWLYNYCCYYSVQGILVFIIPSLQKRDNKIEIMVIQFLRFFIIFYLQSAKHGIQIINNNSNHDCAPRNN